MVQWNGPLYVQTKCCKAKHNSYLYISIGDVYSVYKSIMVFRRIRTNTCMETILKCVSFVFHRRNVTKTECTPPQQSALHILLNMYFRTLYIILKFVIVHSSSGWNKNRDMCPAYTISGLCCVCSPTTNPRTTVFSMIYC